MVVFSNIIRSAKNDNFLCFPKVNVPVFLRNPLKTDGSFLSFANVYWSWSIFLKVEK